MNGAPASMRTRLRSATTTGTRASARGSKHCVRSSTGSRPSSILLAFQPRGPATPRWAHRLVRRFLGDDARRASWPPLELEAARRVEAALDRLGGLDAVDAAPTLDIFRRTLELELAAAHDRVGRLGEGMLAGPVALALGVELERVWVCGLAEGVFPSVPRDDPLLGDTERAALQGELRLRAERVDDDQRALLAVLASTTGARVCTWPRGNLRRSTEHVPSRFLHDTLAAVEAAHIDTVPSYAHGVATVAFPATEHELGVRAALAHEPWVQTLDSVARGRDLLTARASNAFTRFDGNLSGVGAQLTAVSPLDSERPISPTRLELWAGCPHAYLMQSILHVEAVERPEEIMQLSPLDRGSIVHDVLDRFVGEGGARERSRLRELAEEACAAAQARGVTGRRLLWERDRRMILAELDTFADADERYRAERGMHTLATELPFGLADGSHAAVELVWPDGRRLLVRGKADRIDCSSDGALVVIDYKTGSADPYVALSADDPVLAGSRLQLPVYTYAAHAAYADGDDQPIEACYWFVGRGNNRRIGYVVDDAVTDVFMHTVRSIVEGIEAGMFIAHPLPPAPRPFVPCRVLRPRRARHRRSVARMAAQVRRAGARRLPRAAR